MAVGVAPTGTRYRLAVAQSIPGNEATASLLPVPTEAGQWASQTGDLAATIGLPEAASSNRYGIHQGRKHFACHQNQHWGTVME